MRLVDGGGDRVMTVDAMLRHLLAGAFNRPPTPPCPDDETMAAFCEGRLSEQEAPQVAAHMARCDDCLGLFELLLEDEVTQDSAPSPIPALGDHPPAGVLSQMAGGFDVDNATIFHVMRCEDCSAQVASQPGKEPPAYERTIGIGELLNRLIESVRDLCQAPESIALQGTYDAGETRTTLRILHNKDAYVVKVDAPVPLHWLIAVLPDAGEAYVHQAFQTSAGRLRTRRWGGGLDAALNIGDCRAGTVVAYASPQDFCKENPQLEHLEAALRDTAQSSKLVMFVERFGAREQD
jgi:hypothetical protein